MIIDGVRADELANDPNLRGRAGASGTWRWDEQGEPVGKVTRLAGWRSKAATGRDATLDNYIATFCATRQRGGYYDNSFGFDDDTLGAMADRCQAHYFTCLRFMDHSDPAKRSQAARKALAVIEALAAIQDERSAFSPAFTY